MNLWETARHIAWYHWHRLVNCRLRGRHFMFGGECLWCGVEDPTGASLWPRYSTPGFTPRRGEPTELETDWTPWRVP